MKIYKNGEFVELSFISILSTLLNDSEIKLILKILEGFKSYEN